MLQDLARRPVCRWSMCSHLDMPDTAASLLGGMPDTAAGPLGGTELLLPEGPSAYTGSCLSSRQTVFSNVVALYCSVVCMTRCRDAPTLPSPCSPRA